MTINEIVEQFRAREKVLAKAETDVVPHYIEQSRLMAHLRVKARRNWENVCQAKLGIHPRVAHRYVKVGERWSTPDRTPGSEILAQLPSDLHKLEALCELSVDQLTNLVGEIDLRKLERNEVISRVKRMIGTRAPKKEPTGPVRAAFNRWDAFAKRMADDVQDFDVAGKQDFAEEFESLLSQLREAVDKALMGTPPPEAGDEETKPQGAGDAPEEEEVASADDVESDDAEGVEEAPAAVAPVTKGKTPGKARNKP